MEGALERNLNPGFGVVRVFLFKPATLNRKTRFSPKLGFEVQGLGFRVQDSEFRRRSTVCALP